MFHKPFAKFFASSSFPRPAVIELYFLPKNSYSCPCGRDPSTAVVLRCREAQSSLRMTEVRSDGVQRNDEG
jgi:hypothetical protein